MPDSKVTIERAYAAFNRRDTDAALALMTTDVSWPRASESGTVVGHDEIRAYWSRQWQEFDPCVEPLEMTDGGNGQVRVRVHQLVKDLEGRILADGEVTHVFTLRAGLIAAMNLGDETELRSGPTAAFLPQN
jgi:ketosteroid isomerase-like protein